MESEGQPKAHPYYPRTLVLRNYLPNDRSATELMGGFFGLVAILVAVQYAYVSASRPRVSTRQKLVLSWLLACGVIHCVLEGYFALFHASLAGEKGFLAQIWKEYSKGDSRYVSSDNFAVCMESITAFVDGPLCFLTIVSFLKNWPSRYVLQLVVSLCQLYGDCLYFMTEYRDGFSHSEIDNIQYFWFYFMFMNLCWIVIPLILTFQAAYYLIRAQRNVDKTAFGKKRK